MPRSRARTFTVLSLAAIGAVLAPPSALAARQAAAAAPAAPKPFFDVRNERRTAPRLLGRTAPLSAARRGDRRAVAERYLRGHLSALGLARADLGSLRLEQRQAIPGGAQLLGYQQYAGAIPSFDGGLRVMVDARGRVASVSGAAQRGLDLSSATPALSAADAMRALMADVGVRRAVRVASGPSGPTRTTVFGSGEEASLVAFAEGTSARLGWQLDLRAGAAAHYAAVVDATTGKVLYRANRVKAAANDALVWEQYPGAARGGTPQVRDLTPYLNPGATDLSGPYAHAWSDVDDSDSGTVSSDGHIVPFDHPDAGEAVTRTGTGGSFSFPFSNFTAGNAAGACDAGHPCSWNFDVANSWQTNRRQNAVQAFYYVNRYRDHLRAAPIAFKPSDGNFDNGDRILVNTDDGAATGPDSNHRDNAYMDTPPDGESPTMAMFLFFKGSSSPFRDVNGGDDAAVVYHEYTHGLSSRLVTVSPHGEQALNGAQSGGMGEGWSDWYAKDFLISQFPADDTAAPGEVDMGKYVDSVPHSIRSQALDCPVGADAARCPGTPAQGSGGYTYGDFNTTDLDLSGHHEVHEVGEIWAETLWDLRTAVGSDVAKAIITQGMRLSPPEPTFLDERDAILAADRQLFPDGDHSAAIWRVFATRGMGTDAASPTQDVAVEGFKQPPAAALTVSPSPATQGQTVSLDASGSSDADGSIVAYDFDFQGDGTPEITGTTNPRRPDAPAPRAAAAPPATPSATSRAPVITLGRKGTKGRVRFTVRCDSRCTGRAKLTITRKLAKRLHLGKRRTVGTLRVTLGRGGKQRFTIKLSKRTLRAMKRAGVRRIATKLTVTMTDAERQRATRHRTASIRR
jgi:extracellular elastinolytic metalloproteinase